MPKSLKRMLSSRSSNSALERTPTRLIKAPYDLQNQCHQCLQLLPCNVGQETLSVKVITTAIQITRVGFFSYMYLYCTFNASCPLVPFRPFRQCGGFIFTVFVFSPIPIAICFYQVILAHFRFSKSVFDKIREMKLCEITKM